MIIDKKCTCGSKSTGDTTIRCCNLCGLPMPNEPWHFNLDENIFSQVEKPVMPNEVLAGGKKFLDELQKRYIQIKENFEKYPLDFVVTDEMYLIGKILEIYGVQKDKLPTTVEKFIKYESQREA